MGSRLERKSDQVRKRIENHAFTSETGDEYEGSAFGGFSDYFRRKKIKLQNLDAETRANSSQPQIFKGIVCHVNGYTQPSLNDLHKMIVAHGGGFIQYLDGKTMVTHIIASNLTPKKKEEFRRYRIVKPAWIVDSVQAGKLLPWDSYRVVDEGVGQKVLGNFNGAMISQVNDKASGYRDQTDTSWYTEQLRTQKPPTGQLAKRMPQPITPDEDVEDADDPLPEITNSMEDAFDSSLDISSVEGTSSKPRQLLEVRTELETPPPSSTVLSEKERHSSYCAEHATDDSHAHEDEDGLSSELVKRTDKNPQTSGPSEAPEDFSVDFVSHAVVRDSEIMRAVSPSKLADMTAEEHNALLLSDPKIRKSTVVHPDFLEQYYRESRLHHLSTWKADLKSQLQALAAEKTSSQKAREARVKKLPGQRRYIMHVDFDSFFAAVSLKKHPQYINKPCVVAHGGGSGSEIASCNYPARKFGVSNGMWMKRAQELCPELKVLPYDFPAYEDASRKFYSAIMATDGVIQSVSIDEALVDISSSCIAFGGSDGVKRAEGAVNREQSKADEIGNELRSQVLRETGCNVSVGIGGNILLAKVALRKAKPAGQYQLKPEDVLDFIGALAVKSLPGVAWSIGGKLEDIGVTLVKDIREITKEKLVNTLGPKTGDKIWDYSRGIDRTEVGDQVVRKSVSAEVNWGVRFATQEQVDEFMHGLCGELHKRLLKERVKGRQLTMKVMRRAVDAPRDPPKHLGHGKCDTFNKSMQLGVATNDAAIIAKEAIAMLKSFNISPGELRGIGVQMQKLDPIKSGLEGVPVESSQRRLQFKTATVPPTSDLRQGTKAADDPIQDDVHTPEKVRFIDANQPSTAYKPIQQPSTPSKKPLNTLGTQFVLPTQVDPSVLAELPDDIRLKLARHAGLKSTEDTVDQIDSVDSRPTSRAQSPAIELPAQSQLDPSILDALPADVRDEILGFYRSPRKDKGGQALLPQSPRKLKGLPPPRQPLKRKRGGGLLSSRMKASTSSSDHPTLTQANFVSRPQTRHNPDTDGGTTTDTEPEEVDQDFLAALPDDIRAEVLDQQRQARLQRTGGIDLSLHQRPNKKKKSAAQNEGPLDRLLHLPPRPAKPTFTSRKLSELPDLRKAVKAWHEEFSDEGPYDEDIEALCKYLREVVAEEGDMAKVVALVRWMAWVVGEDERSSLDVRKAWENALDRVKSDVQSTVADRGLGMLNFD